MKKPIIGIAADITHTEGERDQAFAFLTYIESLRRAGAIPVLIPPQPENAADIVAALDGILLAGGDDCDPSLFGEERHSTVEPMDPRRQSNDLGLAAAARENNVPTLGVCLGLQVMNVAAGGTLIQDINSSVQTGIEHASTPADRLRHDVHIQSGTRLAAILGSQDLNVNSSHHQAIGRVASGLRTTAKAPDGIVEGLEDASCRFYQGVQWHPEDMGGETSADTLFLAFVQAAREYAESKSQAGTEVSPAGRVQS